MISMKITIILIFMRIVILKGVVGNLVDIGEVILLECIKHLCLIDVDCLRACDSLYRNCLEDCQNYLLT